MSTMALNFLQDETSGAQVSVSASGGAGAAIVGAVVLVLTIASMWKIFSKAGQPGWAALVPIYNLMTLGKITGRAWWWGLVPVLNLIFFVMTPFDLAKSFGKSGGFGFGMLAMSPVFYPMLAFGGSAYQGPSVK